ncbi:MAG: MutS2/Smr-associated SH3 domain-containing protein [Ginsengibacter sp.]
MKLFPESADIQLEFDKIKTLLGVHCNSEFAKHKAHNLHIHTKKEFIEPQLQQTLEYKMLLQNQLYFSNDQVFNLDKEIKLLSIEGAVLKEDGLLQIKKLAENTGQIFRWFDVEKRSAYPALALVIKETYFEKNIITFINDVLDESGKVKDNASETLASVRLSLYKNRNEVRRVFDKVIGRYNKLGYLADIEESFISGRRVLAVFAEKKRMLKGILHGESDSRRTSFIEPEETTALNNNIFSLEIDESREVYKILQALTSKLSVYAPLLKIYHNISGQFDFIKAKAKLAIDVGGNFAKLHDRAFLKLENAFHPLLYLYNKQSGKPTVPVNITLDDKNRILVISGPNAGGKTVTLKTIGLLQIMIQSGLLVPCSADSEFGIFKQLMIHIGDTQNLEFELSTYSSHLKNMKYFMENANGKTLFFIDELGSGSDPNLGGAFAEVIMEELAKKHSIGIVTTHYLNLKVMANKVPGIINGAMTFDEQNLKPLYKLITGKPGSSYTFSIAQRIGLSHVLINKARQLVDEGHFRLDKLLNRTEQDLQKIDEDKKRLNHLLKENESLKKEMEIVLNKERHHQQIELLKHQNKISAEKLVELKDLERKLKALVIEWRKSENKDEIIKMINALLFNQKEKFTVVKQQKKIDEKFEETGKDINTGDKVKMKKSRQVGIVKEIRGKKAIIQIGLMPINVDLAELVAVKERI